MGRGKSKFAIMESDIRKAMEHTISNGQASRYLGVTLKTYKKYALQYFDDDGISLYEKHKNITGKGCKWRVTYSSGEKYTIQDILDGKAPRYPLSKLKPKLFQECMKAEECEECGFNERRVTDYTAPLLLHQKNGNKKDFSLDNLQVLCYNCYYLYVSGIIYRVKHQVEPNPDIEDQMDDDMYDRLRNM